MDYRGPWHWSDPLLLISTVGLIVAVSASLSFVASSFFSNYYEVAMSRLTEQKGRLSLSYPLGAKVEQLSGGSCRNGCHHTRITKESQLSDTGLRKQDTAIGDLRIHIERMPRHYFNDYHKSFEHYHQRQQSIQQAIAKPDSRTTTTADYHTNKRGVPMFIIREATHRQGSTIQTLRTTAILTTEADAYIITVTNTTRGADDRITPIIIDSIEVQS